MICIKCGDDHPETHYEVQRSTGKGYRLKKCKTCRNAERRERRRAKRDWFAEYRKTKSCAHCGIDDPRVLDFHHKDPSKKEFSVATFVHYPVEKIMAEAEKCVVLCSNCHRIEHAKEAHSS